MIYFCGNIVQSSLLLETKYFTDSGYWLSLNAININKRLEYLFDIFFFLVSVNKIWTTLTNVLIELDEWLKRDLCALCHVQCRIHISVFCCVVMAFIWLINGQWSHMICLYVICVLYQSWWNLIRALFFEHTSFKIG